MKKILLIMAVAVLLFGCNVMQDFMEIGEKQKLVQQEIKEKYGWDSQVSWSIHNGKLTQVTVMLKVEDVRYEQVIKLEDAVVDAVAKSFKSKPETIYIQIASSVE